MMKVIVGDRQEGRTTALCRWVMQGYALATPPYWSRIIVAYSRASMRMTTRRLRDVAMFWEDTEVGVRVHRNAERLVVGFPSMNERGPLVGIPGVEYAIDDLELLVNGMLAPRLGAIAGPGAVAICGNGVLLGQQPRDGGLS